MKNLFFKINFVILLFFIHFSIKASAIVIEAESGKLLNTATIQNSSICSGGRKVGNLGTGGVLFSFNTIKSGIYKLDLYYLSAESRNFNITLNGGSASLITCAPSGDWDTPKIQSLQVNLLAGKNTLLLDNSNGYAPDLDMLVLTPVTTQSGSKNNKLFTLNKWKLDIDTINGKTNIYFNELPIIQQTQATFKIDSITYFTENLKDLSVSDYSFSDLFGSGKGVRVIGKSLDDKVLMTQNYYLYNDKDFILTDFTIQSTDNISSNYMAPIYTDSTLEILPSGNNCSLWVPFDNDKWIRYHLLNFGVPITSNEVSALINNTTRKGIIIGSIEHDIWKTGIRISTSNDNNLSRLEVYGGATSNESRDILQHGVLKGRIIKSPKIMLGVFADWRRGMEVFADANSTIAPKLPWSKGKPFAWNSWGAIQSNLTYTNATEVSDYIYNNLQNNNFQNDSTVYIGLDSYWDNISYTNLSKFVKECKNKKQNAGIYWTPFVDWAKDPNRAVEGSSNYLYKDIYLYANGKPQEIAGAYAIDPTHPATKARMDLYLNRFINQGFTYLKLDFMTHGSLEADSHYDTTIYTGIQAYNQGLKYISDFINGKMFINLSISPLFPSQYAHCRRIACDAYANINDTEYTLNSLTYGWWLDHVYTYNDADNIVFNVTSSGENRARLTSSVITGIVCIGDDYSLTGNSTVKTKSQTFLTNIEINRIAKITKAFYPIEISDGSNASDMFMQTVGDTTYLAVFNYSSKSVIKTINMERIGLNQSKKYIIHELWNDTKEINTNTLIINVPKKDVLLYKIYEGTLTSINQNNSENTDIGFFFYPNPCVKTLYIKGIQDVNFAKVIVHNISGQVVLQKELKNNELNIENLHKGLYMVTIIRNDGKYYSGKVQKE